MPFPKSAFQEVPLNQLDLHPDHFRRDSPIKDTLLLKSIQRWGLMKPLHVRKLQGGTFEIVDGYRRYKCAQLLNLESVPCHVYQELSDGDYLYLRFALNELEKPWTKSETAKALRQLRDMNHPDYEEIRKNMFLIDLAGES